MDIPNHIANQFSLTSPVLSTIIYGNGLINKTYLVTLTNNDCYILQQINTQVFPHPELIHKNIGLLYSHVSRAIVDGNNSSLNARNLVFPRLVHTKNAEVYFNHVDFGHWRMFEFIPNTTTFDSLSSSHLASEVGYALGNFHTQVHTANPSEFADTLPGFHIAPTYLYAYDQAAPVPPHTNSSLRDMRFCHEFINKRRTFFQVLESAKSLGQLRPHIIHGDPKLNNILFDRDTQRAISIIDLDTLVSGLLHYDIGDCLRSSCNSAGESPQDPSIVRFDIEIAEAILRPYLLQTSQYLSASDRHFIYDAIRLLPLELGTRFFTDHLVGNKYFRVAFANQNLHRAVVQFKLVQDIENKETEIRRLIADIN